PSAPSSAAPPPSPTPAAPRPAWRPSTRSTPAPSSATSPSGPSAPTCSRPWEMPTPPGMPTRGRSGSARTRTSGNSSSAAAAASRRAATDDAPPCFALPRPPFVLLTGDGAGIRLFSQDIVDVDVYIVEATGEERMSIRPLAAGRDLLEPDLADEPLAGRGGG